MPRLGFLPVSQLASSDVLMSPTSDHDAYAEEAPPAKRRVSRLFWHRCHTERRSQVSEESNRLQGLETCSQPSPPPLGHSLGQVDEQVRVEALCDDYDYDSIHYDGEEDEDAEVEEASLSSAVFEPGWHSVTHVTPIGRDPSPVSNSGSREYSTVLKRKHADSSATTSEYSFCWESTAPASIHRESTAMSLCSNAIIQPLPSPPLRRAASRLSASISYAIPPRESKDSLPSLENFCPCPTPVAGASIFRPPPRDDDDDCSSIASLDESDTWSIVSGEHDILSPDDGLLRNQGNRNEGMGTRMRLFQRLHPRILRPSMAPPPSTRYFAL